MKILPEFREVKKIAESGQYNVVPISCEILSDFTTPIVKFITNFGGAIFLITLTITLFILIRNKKIYKKFKN